MYLHVRAQNCNFARGKPTNSNTLHVGQYFRALAVKCNYIRFSFHISLSAFHYDL